MTKQEARRMRHMLIIAALAVGGIAVLVGAGLRLQDEAFGLGPSIHVADDAYMLASDGEHLLVYGEQVRAVDDRGGTLADLQAVYADDSALAAARVPGLFSDGRVFVPDGILDIRDGSLQNVTWPDGLRPMQLDATGVYGVLEGRPVHVAAATGTVNALPWQEGRGTDWNETSMAGHHAGQIIVWEERSDGNNSSEAWVLWDVADGGVREIPLPAGETITSHFDLISLAYPVAFAGEDLLVVTRGEGYHLRAFDAALQPTWHVPLPGDWTYGGLYANEHHWVVNYKETDVNRWEAVRGFTAGARDEVAGQQQLDGAFLGLGSAGAVPVGDRFAFIEDAEARLADPSRIASWFTWSLLAGGVLLLAAAAILPWWWRRGHARGVDAGARCPECAARLEHGFCIHCGWAGDGAAP